MGNFNSESQLSVNFLQKNYQSPFLAWFHTVLQIATVFIYPVVNPATDTVQEQFRAYMFPIRTNISFLLFTMPHNL